MPLTPEDYKEAAHACWPSKSLEYPDVLVYFMDTEGWADEEELRCALVEGYGPFLFALFKEDHPSLALIEKANISLTEGKSDEQWRLKDQIPLLSTLMLLVLMMVGFFLSLGPAASWHEGCGVPIV